MRFFSYANTPSQLLNLSAQTNSLQEVLEALRMLAIDILKVT